MDAIKGATAVQTTAPDKAALNMDEKPAASQIINDKLTVKDISKIVSENKTGEWILSGPEKALASAIEQINKVVSGANIELRHSIHKPTNTVIVTLVDKDTNDVILEIPPEKVLDAYVERMTLNGLYMDERR